MDDIRFDVLTKRLSDRAGSRRRLFSVVTVGILGAVFTTGSHGESDAKRRKKKKKCKAGTVKCGKKCCPATCVSQSTCGANCKCWFTVAGTGDLGCYNELSGATCCDANAECGQNAGCIAGACNEGGSAGRCFSLCSS